MHLRSTKTDNFAIKNKPIWMVIAHGIKEDTDNYKF